MSFTSFQFILFFGMIYLVNWGYKGICKLKGSTSMEAYKVLLFIESYLFIYLSDDGTMLSLVFLTLVCYLAVKGMARFKEKKAVAKIFFIIGIVVALGQLCLFKYYDFFAENICTLLNLTYNTRFFMFRLEYHFLHFQRLDI